MQASTFYHLLLFKTCMLHVLVSRFFFFFFCFFFLQSEKWDSTVLKDV